MNVSARSNFRLSWNYWKEIINSTTTVISTRDGSATGDAGAAASVGASVSSLDESEGHEDSSIFDDIAASNLNMAR